MHIQLSGKMLDLRRIWSTSQKKFGDQLSGF
jgi:hypothetical protein